MIYKYLKLKYGKDFYRRNIYELKKESQNEIIKLKKGFPVHKVLGYIKISDVKINVSKNVFIPRYETEELILAANKYINNNSRVLDLCTGSGYIALAIKKQFDANVFASDISEDSIRQVKINSKINNLNVKIIKSDLFENIKGKFNVIISNPPYIPNKKKLLKSVVEHEPSLAFFAGIDGNDIYKRIILKYKKYLLPHGVLLLEISEDNVKYFNSLCCEIIKDINSKQRIVIIK